MKKKINSKQKGKRFELQVANYLKSRGYEARRSQQFCGYAEGDPDVISSVMLGSKKPSLECKAVESLNIHKAMEQASRDCEPTGDTPVVIHKKNGKGILVTMKLDDFFDVMEELYRDI